MNWSEWSIARALAVQTLKSKCIVLVDNCSWTGHECDVLGVTTDLRIIDIEIKISRPDLKADAKKLKWWSAKNTHPPKVWKHYYALPKEIWKPEMLECLPSPASGVLLLEKSWTQFREIEITCARRAVPDRNAHRLTPLEVIALARLANIRMWQSRNSSNALIKHLPSEDTEGGEI